MEVMCRGQHHSKFVPGSTAEAPRRGAAHAREGRRCLGFLGHSPYWAMLPMLGPSACS